MLIAVLYQAFIYRVHRILFARRTTFPEELQYMPSKYTLVPKNKQLNWNMCPEQYYVGLDGNMLNKQGNQCRACVCWHVKNWGKSWGPRLWHLISASRGVYMHTLCTKLTSSRRGIKVSKQPQNVITKRTGALRPWVSISLCWFWCCRSDFFNQQCFIVNAATISLLTNDLGHSLTQNHSATSLFGATLLNLYCDTMLRRFRLSVELKKQCGFELKISHYPHQAIPDVTVPLATAHTKPATGNIKLFCF